MRNMYELRGVIFDSFAGNESVAKKYPQEVRSLAIANDGSVDVEIDLGYCKVTVKPGEVFDDNIVPQRSFTVNATDSYRCIARGEC